MSVKNLLFKFKVCKRFTKLATVCYFHRSIFNSEKNPCTALTIPRLLHAQSRQQKHMIDWLNTFKVDNKVIKMTSIDITLVSSLKTCIMFPHQLDVFLVVLEQFFTCCVHWTPSISAFWYGLYKIIPSSNHFFKDNNAQTRAIWEIWSKLTIKTLERHHWGQSDVFIVNFEQILHLPVLLFLILNK